MYKNIVIDPIYLLDEFPLCMNGKLPWFDKYEIFRLVSVYDKIYVDKRWFLQIVENFSGDKVLIDAFNNLFDLGILIDIPFEKIFLDYVIKSPIPLDCTKYYQESAFALNIAMLRRLHEANRVAKDVDLLPLESIYTHIQFSLDNESLLFSPMSELLICFVSSLDSGKVTILKDNLKIWSIGKTFLKHCIPSFEIKTYAQYEKFIEVRKYGIKIFQTKIEEMAKDFGGYVLRENEVKKIRDYITISENELFAIKKLFEGISLGADIGIDIASLIISFPASTIKTIILNLSTNQDIKNKNLGWLIYTHSLKAFQKSETMTEKCELCNLSIAEIDSLTDDEVNNIIFTRNLCTGHMIVKLNVRKLLAAYGKDLIRLIKENENDVVWNLGTPLGMD